MSEIPGKSINAVVAENLRFWMVESGLVTQTALAAKSGVSQRTIGNYLNPDLRDVTSSGKEASAKLTELDKLATALGVEVWQLLRQLTPQERAFYDKIEAAYKALRQEQRAGPDSGVGELR